jgi:hypothetical protein
MNHYKILFAKVNVGNRLLGQSRLICFCPIMNTFTHPPIPLPAGLSFTHNFIAFHKVVARFYTSR